MVNTLQKADKKYNNVFLCVMLSRLTRKLSELLIHDRKCLKKKWKWVM